MTITQQDAQELKELASEFATSYGRLYFARQAGGPCTRIGEQVEAKRDALHDFIDRLSADSVGAEAVARVVGFDPTDPTKGAHLPMIPSSWRFGFWRANGGLEFRRLDEGAFVIWDAVKDAVFASMAKPGDWPEDFGHENGQYLCSCCECKRTFTAHKRRVVCKLCALAAPSPAPAVPSVDGPPEDPTPQMMRVGLESMWPRAPYQHFSVENVWRRMYRVGKDPSTYAMTMDAIAASHQPAATSERSGMLSFEEVALAEAAICRALPGQDEVRFLAARVRRVCVISGLTSYADMDDETLSGAAGTVLGMVARVLEQANNALGQSVGLSIADLARGDAAQPAASQEGDGKDVARLDWLESRQRIEAVHDGRIIRWSLHVDHDLYCYPGTTLREAIDAARDGGAK